MDQVTAWGKCVITSGATGADDAMGAVLTNVGIIKEDSTKLELEAGDVKELYGEGHELVDQRQLEGKFKLSFTIIKASLTEIAKLYGITLADGAKELPIVSSVINEKRSYVVTPELEGAIGAKLPKCTTQINPIMQTAEGWTLEVIATGLKPADGAACTLFQKATASAE